MTIISLVTLGSPEQLTGGYLYHRRMADAAPDHDARIEFRSAHWWTDPFDDRADVVLVDSIAAAVVAPWAWRRRPRGALAAILHQPPGGIDHGRPRRKAQARLDRALYRRCQLLVAASEALRDEVVREHGLPAERLVVVAPGSDVAPPPAPADVPELRHGRRVAFVSVGNWVARKGTAELLEAFARLPEEAATLHLAGRHDIDPRYAAGVQARLADPALAGRVVVHGAISRDAVARLYHGADAFVLPSYREPYGTVYGEALAAGLPVVGWRAGNLPHLITDGREGVVLEPGDVSALSETLRRLAADDPWRAQLTEAARRRGALLPTWEDSASELFGLLRRLAGESGRPPGTARR